MKQIVVYQEKCTVCRQCEMACSFSHEGVFNASLSRIRVNDFYNEQFYLPMVCVHCADAPCAAVCPTVAIERQPDGQVAVLAERCIGCKMCLLACPFGVMGFSPEKGGGVAHNCDLCVDSAGNKQPQCVQFCTPGALAYEDVPTEALSRQKFAVAIARQSQAAA